MADHIPIKTTSNKLGDFFTLLILGLCGVVFPAIIIYKHILSSSTPIEVSWVMILGSILSILGFFVSGLNFHLSFTRPWLYNKKHGNLDEYRFVSGLPMFGGTPIFLGSLFVPSSIIYGVIAIFFYLIDTCGIHWFFYAIIMEYIKNENAELHN